MGSLGFVGQTGLGKSTLINTIFASHLIDTKGRFAADEPVRQTTEIQAASHGMYCLFVDCFYEDGLTLCVPLSYCRERCKAEVEHCRYPRVW
jgi:ABC-type sugar transport system ATPase subunit